MRDIDGPPDPVCPICVCFTDDEDCVHFDPETGEPKPEFKEELEKAEALRRQRENEAIEDSLKPYDPDEGWPGTTSLESSERKLNHRGHSSVAADLARKKRTRKRRN
jgi:hypothetical protein